MKAYEDLFWWNNYLKIAGHDSATEATILSRHVIKDGQCQYGVEYYVIIEHITDAVWNLLLPQMSDK